MEVDDTKHLYEVDQQSEFDGKDDFPHRPITNIKINDQISSSKWPMFLLVGIQVTAILILIILLGVNGVTLTHLNTLPICDQSTVTATANTSGLTSGGTGNSSCSCNCTGMTYSFPSVVNCSNNIPDGWNMLATQVGQIVNMSTMVLNNQIDDNTDGMAQSNLLMQVNQRLVNNLTRLVNTADRTEGKVDDIQTSINNQNNVMANNVTNVLAQVWDAVDNTTHRLTNIVSTLSDIKGTGTSTAGVIDDVLLAVNELLELQNASAIFNSITPVSCADIKSVLPNSPSGYYHVNSRTIYCNMGELCGIDGAWTRIGYLNMADGTQTCPSGFKYYQTGSARACGRTGSAPSCTPSISIPTNGLNYTQICGKIEGYQVLTPDAVAVPNHASHNDIDSYYLDGISITRGTPREHVWSLMAGYTPSNNANPGYICPCATGSNQQIQSWIGNNYYCESAHSAGVNNLQLNDPLWDGLGCGGTDGPCCQRELLPWFLRDYGNATSSADLEMRICGDEPASNNEDTPVSAYQIYIK